MNYWQECIEIAFNEAGITATPEQIKEVAGAVETSHEYYGQAHGHDCIPNPMVEENEKLQKQVQFLRNHTCEWQEHSRSSYMSGEADDVYSHCVHCGKDRHTRG